LYVIPQNEVEIISDIEKRINLRLPLLILWYCYEDFQICRFILMMYSGVDASLWNLKLTQFLGPSLRKRIGIQNYEYKIRCESEYLFRMRKEITTN